MGDILINCTGGTPGGVVGGNLTVFLSVNVTNKLTNNFTDVQMTVDTGSGPVAANVAAQPFGANAVVFNGLSFVLSVSGQANLRIGNLRGALVDHRRSVEVIGAPGRVALFALERVPEPPDGPATAFARAAGEWPPPRPTWR